MQEDGDALILAEEYGTRIGEKFKSAAQFKDGQCEAQHEKDGKEILELVKKEYNIDGTRTRPSAMNLSAACIIHK